MQKNVSIVILDPTPGAAAALGTALAAAAPADVDITAQGVASAADLKEALAQSPADCILLQLQGSGDDAEQDLLNRFARQAGGPATVVLADGVPLDRVLEWVHRGIQDVIPPATAPVELVRGIMMAMERKRLLNDANEALRLEQENVLKMQNFIDELVGLATRTASMGG